MKLDVGKLIYAFIYNGFSEKDAFNAAFDYRNSVEIFDIENQIDLLMIANFSQDMYNEAIAEELEHWY
ncbi:hypothetical protein ABY59_0200020 [Enterobacter phage phiEap-2]|jgi:hypothetical protein|uniref:hypothetical protein n=1 Tax=Enterobacter phage phiEap-2 TaxID=1701257 RepID=UPI0006BC1428|nr:hypothetical protein ABY59_0200020 [Enterobacter phage phiEap-2]ALA45587.1 hypothetical protein ABY59_0200020 [Enterobacter phage phiEap-2]